MLETIGGLALIYACRTRADGFDGRDAWLSPNPRIYGRLSRYHLLAHTRPLADADGCVAEDRDPAGGVARGEFQAWVARTVNDLPKRERYIIMRRFGLDGQPEATLKTIGRSLGLTRERIRQLEAKALEKLRPRLMKRLAGRDSETLENPRRPS